MFDNQNVSFNVNASLYYSFLGWMGSLQSLVITKRYCFQYGTGIPIFDPYLSHLFYRMLRHPAISLRRLWVDDNHYSHGRDGIRDAGKLAASSVTSLVVGHGDIRDNNMDLILNSERFRHLKHFGCIRFERLAQFPDLQYACGHWDGYHAVMMDPF